VNSEDFRDDAAVFVEGLGEDFGRMAPYGGLQKKPRLFGVGLAPFRGVKARQSDRYDAAGGDDL